MSPEGLSLLEAAAAIRARSLSSELYAAALFGRMDAVESQIHAWKTVDRELVLREARRCDAEAAKGTFRGPLHGVPIGVKDIFYTEGLRTTMGSELYGDFVPGFDARAVRRLKEAGAIVLGKTVTTVFAYFDPGPTRNPWNLDHTPGGSSSGSAAAVASRMCAAAIGSQTLGSVGRPAAFNGVASLVPTQERISRKGVFPLAWSLDHVGIFARSVADIDLMLECMTESPLQRPQCQPPFRIGVVRDFFYEHATEETRSLNDGLARKLAAAGFEVREVKLPGIFETAYPMLKTILRVEAASVHERLFTQRPETYGEKLRAVIETGMLVDAMQYMRARRLRRMYQAAMARLFDHCDVLMTPAACGTAPKGITATGDPIMNLPWTLADFPIVTLPYEQGAGGLPVGVQLSGPALHEGLLLGVAKAVESVIAFSAQPNL
jgi:aspartyl-tRNA(Asn)/glutamyl-tRNA(Gln) amidotransferase subunit A